MRAGHRPEVGGGYRLLASPLDTGEVLAYECASGNQWK